METDSTLKRFDYILFSTVQQQHRMRWCTYSDQSQGAVIKLLEQVA